MLYPTRTSPPSPPFPVSSGCAAHASSPNVSAIIWCGRNSGGEEEQVEEEESGQVETGFDKE